MSIAPMPIAGVAGWPIHHSLSPKLHGYWLSHYAINGAYVPLSVEPQHLETTLKLLPQLGFAGLNLTLPLKESAYALCAALGVTDAAAHKTGAVNTVVFEGGRIAKATNTDGIGFLQNLKSGAPDWNPAETSACILGAGGAARGILCALQDAGVPSITLLNRTRERAVALASLFPNVTVGEWEQPATTLANTSLLINATSLGMQGQPPLELPLEDLPKSAIVTDSVYRPLHTGLLKKAASRGNPVVDGLGMLLYQAVPGFEAWFGIKPEVTPELRTYLLTQSF